MALNPNKLHIGDNGRLFCGKLDCAGMTASATGHDLSGQPVHELNAADLDYLRGDFKAAGLVGPCCETCGITGEGVDVPA